MGQPLADCDFNLAALHQLTPSSASRARREHRHPKASTTKSLPPLTPLENRIRRFRPSIAIASVGTDNEETTMTLFPGFSAESIETRGTTINVLRKGTGRGLLERFPFILHRILRRRDSWRILAG
jgi:hypothetical protein